MLERLTHFQDQNLSIASTLLDGDSFSQDFTEASLKIEEKWQDIVLNHQVLNIFLRHTKKTRNITNFNNLKTTYFSGFNQKTAGTTGGSLGTDQYRVELHQKVVHNCRVATKHTKSSDWKHAHRCWMWLCFWQHHRHCQVEFLFSNKI